MSLYTYTHAYTRSQAVVDQISVLFLGAGISESDTAEVCHGVQEKWLQAVGIYLVRNGQRVYEMEAGITWSAYSDSAELEFSSDLPGWEDNGSPEAIILGKRFAGVAKQEGLTPRCWVLFTAAIRADPALHERLCGEVGATFGGGVPKWAATPTTRSLPLQDLREIGLSERSAL